VSFGRTEQRGGPRSFTAQNRRIRALPVPGSLERACPYLPICAQTTRTERAPERQHGEYRPARPDVIFFDDSYRAEAELIEGKSSPIVERRLNDGTPFRVVKSLSEPKTSNGDYARNRLGRRRDPDGGTLLMGHIVTAPGRTAGAAGAGAGFGGRLVAGSAA
jgi:hypothetical protein